MDKGMLFAGLVIVVGVSLVVVFMPGVITGDAVKEMDKDSSKFPFNIGNLIKKKNTDSSLDVGSLIQKKTGGSGSSDNSEEKGESKEADTTRTGSVAGAFGGGGGGGSSGGTSTQTVVTTPEGSNLCLSEFDVQTHYPDSYSYSIDQYELYRISEGNNEMFVMSPSGELSVIIAALEIANYEITTSTADKSGVTYFSVTDVEGFLVDAPVPFVVSASEASVNEVISFINNFEIGC